MSLKSTLFAPNFTAGQAEVHRLTCRSGLQLGIAISPALYDTVAVPVSTHRSRVHVGRGYGVPEVQGSLFHSNFRFVSTSSPVFRYTTTTITYHYQPLKPSTTFILCFAFLVTLKAGMFPTGHGNSVCIDYTLIFTHTVKGTSSSFTC